MKDELGDRMKRYEALVNPRLLEGLPVLARLDGRSFHAFAHNAERPFDPVLQTLMARTTRHLVVESCADVGYTQSDEITLAWLSVPFFDGNPQKMCSTLAAMCSVYFNLQDDLKSDRFRWIRMPTFDCRAWAVPSVSEAANVFLWRQQDATRNSVQMAARAVFSHAACDGLDTKQLQEKLFAERGVNWNDYPPASKRGTFVRHVKTTRAFTAEELADLPPLHDARKNPDAVVERRSLVTLDVDLRSMSHDERIAALFEDR